jgi:hypothetical protein
MKVKKVSTYIIYAFIPVQRFGANTPFKKIKVQIFFDIFMERIHMHAYKMLYGFQM